MIRHIALALSAAFAFFTASSQTLPPWRKGWFDIHHIATGKGECQFLVFPDGTTILIDCGDMTGEGRGWAHSKALPDSTKSPAEWAAHYIDSFSPTPGHLDYVLLSHFHRDHMAGLPELAGYFDIGLWVDRGYPDYDFPSVEKVEKQDKGVKEYKAFVGAAVKEGKFKAEGFKVGSHKQFVQKRKNREFDIWNVAGALMITDKKGKIRKMYTEDPMRFDENMFSCAQLFRYGDFRYFSGGDIPGMTLSKKKDAPNRDYESQIADLVAPCSVIKANHHGYRDSTNPYYLWKMAPDVVIIDAIEASHPRRETMARLCDKAYPGKRLLYATSEAGREKMANERLFSQFSGIGHIVVRVYDGGETFQVFVLNAKSLGYEVLSKSEILLSAR